MTDMTIPDPPDATWADRLQSALYPWLGRPEWWPADFGDRQSDHVEQAFLDEDREPGGF